VADRHEIEDRERRQGEVSHQRIGHVKQGVVAPLADAYATKGVGASALQGVDLRRAVVLREILGPPVALRDSDDYFSP
jgi:hypothetical protein